jgi:hypothetical protein
VPQRKFGDALLDLLKILWSGTFVIAERPKDQMENKSVSMHGYEAILSLTARMSQINAALKIALDLP